MQYCCSRYIDNNESQHTAQSTTTHRHAGGTSRHVQRRPRKYTYIREFFLNNTKCRLPVDIYQKYRVRGRFNWTTRKVSEDLIFIFRKNIQSKKKKKAPVPGSLLPTRRQSYRHGVRSCSCVPVHPPTHNKQHEETPACFLTRIRTPHTQPTSRRTHTLQARSTPP